MQTIPYERHPIMTEEQLAALRERVIESSLQLFLKHGIRTIKMDDVAAAIKISKRTLYQLFADKSSLLEACLHKRFEQNEAWFEEIVSHTDDVLEIVLQQTSIVLNTISNMPPGFLKDLNHYPNLRTIRLEYHNRQRQRAVELLNMGAEQGMLSRNVNYQLFYVYTGEAADIIINNDTLAEFAPLDLFHSIFIPLLRGCATPEGLTKIDRFVKTHLSSISPKE